MVGALEPQATIAEASATAVTAQDIPSRKDLYVRELFTRLVKKLVSKIDEIRLTIQIIFCK